MGGAFLAVAPRDTSGRCVPYQTVMERLMAKTRKLPGGCWEWAGVQNGEGYGKIRVGGRRGRNESVHRVAYQHLVGPIPDGLTIDHLCRNRVCVNPEHLEAVPIVTNVMRGEGACAKHARNTHCPKGHPYDIAGADRKGRPHRRCSVCTKASAESRKDKIREQGMLSSRRYRERHKEAIAKRAHFRYLRKKAERAA